jgi:hypothetical protein
VDDRRKFTRIDAAESSLRVVNAIDGRQLGIVGNLSMGGLLLITSQQELYPSGILQLEIERPAEIGGGTIPLGVKVLWCTPAHSPESYWAGLETIDLGEPEREALASLLDYLER